MIMVNYKMATRVTCPREIHKNMNINCYFFTAVSIEIIHYRGVVDTDRLGFSGSRFKSLHRHGNPLVGGNCKISNLLHILETQLASL